MSQMTHYSHHDLAPIHCLAERCFLTTGVCSIFLLAAPGWFVTRRLAGAVTRFHFLNGKTLFQSSGSPPLKITTEFTWFRKSGHYQEVLTPTNSSPFFWFVSAHRTPCLFLLSWMTVLLCGFSQLELWTQTSLWRITWQRPHVLSFWHLDKKIAAASQFNMPLSKCTLCSWGDLCCYVLMRVICSYSRELKHLLDDFQIKSSVLYLPRELLSKFISWCCLFPPKIVIKSYLFHIINCSQEIKAGVSILGKERIVKGFYSWCKNIPCAFFF